jgi:hypothetical protein
MLTVLLSSKASLIGFKQAKLLLPFIFMAQLPQIPSRQDLKRKWRRDVDVPSEGEGGVNFRLNLNECIQNHRTTRLQVNGEHLSVRLGVLLSVVSVNLEIGDWLG